MEELEFQNRRNFIGKLFGGLAALFTLSSFSFLNQKKTKTTKLTVLHTNDMHSHIDPFDINDKHFPNKGGMIRIASLVNKIRQNEEHVILLDAGDVFQGTPYFNLFKGEVEFKLMSAMRYDASTLGNHDFDNGLEGFNNMLPHAKFPFICSNYDFENTILKDKTFKYKILKKGNLKIGIFGIGIKLEGLVTKDLYKETKYLNPYTTANHYAKLLKEKKKCNLVICLSHLGYNYEDPTKESDINLAKSTKNIDLIIGGHTHTFLDKANVHKNSIGKDILVNQAGWGALSLGRVDFYFNKKNSQRFDLDATTNHTKNYAKI
jgi:5'-nucleotidase